MKKPEGMVEGVRGGRGVIVAAPRNEETQITIVPPTTTTSTTTNLTVAVAATGRELALVPARNSVELETIMQNVVADNSRNQYNTRYVGFVLWLYKNPDHQSLLLSELFEDLKNIDGDGGNGKIIRSTIKVAIKEMNRYDSKSCPIKLENLTFAIFAGYLLSLRPNKKKKKRRKRRRQTVKQEIEGEESSASCVKETSEEEWYLSKLVYGSSRSTLMHLYREYGATMSDRFQNELANIMRVMKQNVEKQKENLGAKVNEGKIPMSFHVYEKLC